MTQFLMGVAVVADCGMAIADDHVQGMQLDAAYESPPTDRLLPVICWNARVICSSTSKWIPQSLPRCA